MRSASAFQLATGTISFRWGKTTRCGAFVLIGMLNVDLAMAGSIIPLGDLVGGSIESIAYAISYDGSTVVGASRSSLGVEAFSWSSG